MSGADDEWMAQYDAWEATRDRMRAEFIEQARARFARDRVVSVESYGDEVRFTSSLTKATRPGVAYQVTDFEGDEPIGHHEYDDLDEALGGLWDLASPRTKGVPPVPNPAPVDPDIVGALVSGEYCGTPFVGRVHALDAYGHAEIDVPLGWIHRGRDYSEGIMTDAEGLTVVQPREHGKVAYANERWAWMRAGGKPWPRNRRTNPSRYRYLGTDDEESSCSCCGKQGLKRVAWLVELDEEGNEIGGEAPYGTTCASMLIQEGHKDPSKKKPTKSQAEKVLEADRQATLAQALEQAQRLTPPEPEVYVNEHGVPMIRLGDVERPRMTALIGRGYFPVVPARDLFALRDWQQRRAAEIATAMGLKGISAQRNPSTRLRRASARISNP